MNIDVMTSGNQKIGLGYIRISDKKQIQGESPETQRKVIQEYADRNGIIIIKWFYDEAKSGKNTERDELQSLLRLAIKYKGKIDYFIVYKMSRASRDLDSYIMTVKSVLKARGISIRSATEPFDDSPMGTFVQNLHVMVAQLDNEIKRDTVIDNMTGIAKQGWWQHNPPIGFDKCRVSNADGKERPSLKANAMGVIVRKVLLRFARGDMTVAALTRYAETEGLRSINGQPLLQEAIKRLLKRPENAAYVHDKFTNYELVEGQHQGLIDKETYWQIQKLLSMKQKDYLLDVKHKQTNEKYPLRKFLRCPHCQTILTASAPKNSPRYFCRNCRGVPSLATRIVHEKFVELLHEVQPTPSTLKLYKELLRRQAIKELGHINADISEIRRKLDSLAKERTKVLRKFTLDQLDKGDKDMLIDALDTEKIALVEELSALEDQQTIQETNIEYALNFMGNVAKVWADAPLELKIKFQNLIFPEGLELDTSKQIFRTSKISPLYRYIPNKKELSDAENSLLVTPRGIEPLLPG